ncbi:MAG: hypothetical protein JXL84_12475 [Deltaproteobacteria bacterium]|nr:hypothetical protein [Deltaproteobacteria bacterium]
MIPRNAFYSLVLALSLIVSSCTAVVWENPMVPVADAVGDVRLPGAWKTPDDDAFIYIGKSVEGWMSFACVPADPKEGDKPFFGKMFASRLGRRTFLNIRLLDWDPDLSGFYLIAEYRLLGGGRLAVSIADSDFVKEEIGKNLLAAETREREDIFYISCESKHIREFVKRSPRERLFPDISRPESPLIRLR